MKRRRIFKKGLALLLAFAMVVGMLPVMSGVAREIKAATGTGYRPSVTAYATSQELMNSFAPDENGNGDTIGKLVFGKKQVEHEGGDYTYEPMEWYILGNDTGVDGDNIIIFAASPIISASTGQVFEEDYGVKKTDSSLWADCDYGDGVTVTEVASNHYGASDLRVALKAVAGNINHFTFDEQALMNVTTVITTDVNNIDDNYEYLTYTTTDKLYALETANTVYADTTLEAGSDNQITLERDSYWHDEDYFWLRTPGNNGTGVFAATPNDDVDSQMGLYASSFDLAIRPASNLNLSSVLFASAADTSTSSGRIAAGTAMTLRLDGSGKDFGAATYNAGEGTIEARKGDTSQTVTLVVQGNDGTDDWYYSKQINGTETVDASDIKTELGLASDIDLSVCRIWIEMTYTNGMIYAVNAEKAIAKINTAFVTKEQLMNSFKTYSDGIAANYGKLVFGKNESGEAQEWYILGKDDDVSGENTIILAASPIATNQIFNPVTTGITIADIAEDDIRKSLIGTYYYTDIASPALVNANHYGISSLRAALKAMAGNEDYFTLTEQGMMNATTVTTWDKENIANYTTTDTLYAPAANIYDIIIKAGTNNQTVLDMSKYWDSGSFFWMRSPHDVETGKVNVAVPGDSVSLKSADLGGGVRPASNLKLSNVLFASGATAASDAVSAGIIISGTAVTLRLDGTDTAMGTVIYDANDGEIVAQKDAGAAGTVSLVVQGNDGTNDWYYSAPVGERTVVTSEQIKTACGISTLSLADCHIWLETTIADMAYAKMAQTKGIEIISSVEVAGMKPVGGTAFNTEALCATAGIVTTAPAITYTTEVDGGDVVVTGMADWNKTYKATVTLSADTSGDSLYVFGNTVSVTVDGVALSGDFTPNTDGTLTITNEYTTDKRKIQSVNTPTVPIGNIFTNYYGYAGYDDVLTGGSNNELGTQVTVTFSDSVTPNTQAMDVTWSIANDGGAAYDKTPGATNTFRWTITDTKIGDYNLTNCSNYDAATGTITGTVTITNKAATPVTITGTDSTTKYADTTIDVSQYFTIDTNAGTPSYSLITGTTGGTGVGTLSGSVLTVTRTGTFMIKVSTGANGIYAADEKTITLTVDNGTISYTASDYSGTYDGQSHSINVAVDFPTGTTITYSTDGTNYGSNKPSFTNEGTYTVYYRITKDNYDTVNGSRTVTINKKALTITAAEQTVMWGNSIDQTKYTVSTGGLITGDSISEITLIPSTTVLTDNGTISISGVKIVNTSGTDVTGNYKITTGNGVLKVIHNTTLAPDRIQAVKAKTAYKSGETLNVNDITVTAYYSDGYSGVVTGYTTNVSSINMSTVGNKTLTVSYTENGATKTADINIAVSHDTTLAPDRIQAVKVKTAYKSGENLNVDDITVTAYYTDGYSKTVTGYTTNASSIDMSTVGNKTLTVYYTENGATKTDDITIAVSHDTTLAPDRIQAVKTKTAYIAGDTLNVDDITVTVYYTDDYSKTVTGYITNVSSINMSTVGNKTLTVSYTENGTTKTDDITITVSHDTTLAPDRIQAVKVKTDYTAGDTLNVNDITVTVYYTDGYIRTVTGYNTNVSSIDMSIVGDKTLTVSYTENGTTKTDDITITVGHKTTLAPDRIVAVKVKTAYKSGETLNVDDITVTAYYTDGYSRIVTGYTTNVSSINMSTVGNKTLTVYYTENGATKTADITIAVGHDTTLAPDRIQAVKVKTAYKSGETLNVDDITVTAYYTDGYSRTVTGYTTNAAAIDMSVMGEKMLTISYTENGITKTADITITVSHNTTLAPDRIQAVKTKTAYKAGQNLNVDDITVTSYYSDGYSEMVTDYTTNVAAIDMTTAGDKTLTVTYVKNGATKTADITVEVTYFTVTLPQTQTGYTLTADTLNALWNGSVSITFTLADGYSKTGAFAVKVNGNAVTLDADGRYTCSGVMNNITFTVEGVADTTGPSAEIKVAVNRWSSFLNDITFGLFFKDTQDVVITTADAGSGVDKVYYYLSDIKMTRAEVQEITSWTEYKNIFAINPNKEYVIYVKAVDKAGNTTYVCSEGIVMDDIKPVISGIEDGRTYYGDVNFSVNDRYLNKVFLDGTEITSENGTYTILADNATHTVKAVDKAENEVSCTITVNYSVFEKTTSGYSGTYDGKAHGITVNVLNAQDAKVTYSTDGVNYSATNPQFTDKGTYRVYYKVEKDRYTTVTDSVMVTITARELSVAAQDQNVIWNSEIDQTKYTVSENGLAEGHTISQITLAPSTTALTDNGTISISGIKIINASGTDVTLNYDITKVDGKLAVTHDTTLTPDRIEAVKTKTAYTAGDTLNVDDITVTAYYADGYSEMITGYTTNAADIDMAVVGDKTLTISYATQAGTLTKDIAVTVSKKSYLITDGAGGSHTIGSGKNMTVTGNGEFDKFAGINIDGNAVDENNYTAREGSTIITLKAAYLDTLSVGTHTIELVWIDGSASGEFTINESIPVEPEIPETGDSTPVGMLFVLLLGSGLVAAGSCKKKKYIVKG